MTRCCCYCPCSGRSIALDVARGLSYLHARRIVHIALKPSVRRAC